ncbi:MAG: DUF5989 family protein [Elusimicrobia bacterium]|nr:DUF5989 family protein [Elusimicrobiota bacterium]
MNKLVLILKECFHLIRRHKLYFLMPLLITLALLGLLIYQLGPTVVISFVYAGI